MHKRKQHQHREATKKCNICCEADAKYKCPTCRIPFCSVVCSKKHKETPCEPYVERKPFNSAKRANHNANKSQYKKPLDMAAPRRFENDLDSSDDLTKEQLDKLDTNEVLQSKLKDSRLVETLRVIQGASDKKTALDAEMQHPEFLQFCDEILDCVGYQSD